LPSSVAQLRTTSRAEYRYRLPVCQHSVDRAARRIPVSGEFLGLKQHRRGASQCDRRKSESTTATNETASPRARERHRSTRCARSPSGSQPCGLDQRQVETPLVARLTPPGRRGDLAVDCWRRPARPCPRTACLRLGARRPRSHRSTLRTERPPDRTRPAPADVDLDGRVWRGCLGSADPRTDAIVLIARLPAAPPPAPTRPRPPSQGSARLGRRPGTRHRARTRGGCRSAGSALRWPRRLSHPGA
jgi:hypothetical protein